ncbi:DUF401 family protein [Anoxynatronum buryatiense]|uniref:DUF401 family protein n=1 Tax=Anoxynatronum buryatiense TaxID=489973 RepID=A0AA45WT62_9CLOT|nr:DUF401 family protein [Anoxynatronum buryatiense]SMP40910.1 hypothetical protein SAMN06296020_101435 [Anoxynatronum buryatiense]
MNQLIATLVAFLCIPVLLHLKVKLSHTIAVTAGILAVLSGIGLPAVGQVATGVFTHAPSRDTILTVLLVSVVGGAMKHYGVLDRIVTSILALVSSKRTVLVIIPGLIGTLIIPGGAILSAPFVDEIGADAGLAPARRAAVNLVFRHVAMILFPFSSTILLIRSSLPHINIYWVLLLTLIFLFLALTVAYFLYLKNIPSEPVTEAHQTVHRAVHLRHLFLDTAPIYVPVLINAATGLPFYMTMLVSIGIVYLQSNRHRFFQVLWKSASWDTVLIIIAVLVMKDIILQMDSLLMLFDAIFAASNSSLSVMGVFMATSLFFGFITGNINAPLAVTLPMLIRISTDMTMVQLHIFAYFLLISAFLGYYFSPLHLCQTFTLKMMKVTTGQLYREYRLYAPATVLILMVTTLSLLTLTR